MRPASMGADGSWITEFPYTVHAPNQQRQSTEDINSTVGKKFCEYNRTELI